MKKILTIVFLLALFTFIGKNQSYASHFAGADLTYKCLGGNTYEITLSFYRDCSGISAPSIAPIVFNCSSNPAYNFTQPLQKIPGTGIEITQPCSSSPTSCTTGANSQYGIREYIYQGVVTLPACNSWTMHWTSGARNPITTLNGSGSWYVYAKLNNLSAPCNSSPTFANRPIIIVNNNQNHNFSQGAIDIDGDSLSYSFFAPNTNSQITTVTYIPPYSYTNFMPSSTPTTIDSITGEINFTPNQVLNTICGIEIEEWRTINGTAVLIGVIHRDVQINIINSSNHIPRLSGIDTSLSHSYNVNDTIYEINTCGPITFDINGYDQDTFSIFAVGHPERFSISWDGGIPGATFTPHYNGTDSAYATFWWYPNSNDYFTDKYFTATITDEACPYNTSQSYTYAIIAKAMLVDIGTDILLCKGESTIIKANATVNTVNYIWSIDSIPFGVAYNQDSIVVNTSNLTAGIHIISIKTNDGTTTTCPGMDMISLDIIYQPNIQGTLPDSFICYPSTITYDAGPGTIYDWTDFNGSPVGNAQTYTTSSSGVYRVYVDGGNNTRCTDVDTFIVTVLPSPPNINFGQDTTITSSQTLSLSLIAGSNYTYAWNTGASTQSIIIDNSFNWINKIIGTVTASNQCFSSDTIIVYIGNVGFDNNLKDIIKVSPNPVNSILNIELQKEYGNNNIQIYNTQGQIIKSETFSGKTHKIESLDNLSKGVYFIYISNPEINIVMKFIKE